MQTFLHERGWRPTWREILHVALGISEALVAVHNAGVVHRDIKPGNVLVDAAGGCVLSDFGLAQAAQKPSAAAIFGPSGGFHKHRVVGTVQYLAPEVLMNSYHEKVRCTRTRVSRLRGPDTLVVSLGA
jgi:serine/threonine protein kinase